MNYRIINGKACLISDISSINSNKNLNSKKTEIQNGNSFKDILNKEIESVNSYKISKHAAQRLESSNFTNSDYKNLENGLFRAKEKGSRNTVMIYKEMAIVASVENNTIITAVDKTRASENVFTNIDSVVII